MEVGNNLVWEWWELWLLISVGLSRSAALAAVQIFMVTKIQWLTLLWRVHRLASRGGSITKSA